jgi:cytochrome b6-f complex iron-sulfur subunit
MDEKKETKEEKTEGQAHETHEAHEAGPFTKNRRQFLFGFAGVVGALGAAEFAVPLLASFTPVQRGKPEPAVINFADVPENGFVSGVFAGYTFLAFNRKAGIECISLKCSHLGCTVKWNEAENKFKCPCHDGWFDEHGINKGGPPPAPLEKLVFKVAGDKLIVGGA